MREILASGTQGRTRPGGAPLAAALVALLAMGACARRPAVTVAAPQPAETFIVREVSIPDLKPVEATLTSRDTAEARARISGTLASLTVKAGDLVRRGQVIGRVVDQRLGFETGAWNAQVAAADAQNARAQADLARIRDLYDHGVYAKARLDQATAEARSAAGGLAAARAQRSASAETAAQGAVFAPADGRVLKADVPAGSVVMAGQSVATVSAGPTVLRAEAPEAVARNLKIGEAMALSSPDLGPGIASAKILQIYPDVTDGQVRIDLTAPGAVGALQGERMRLELQVGRRDALIAPRRFIVSKFGMDYARLAVKGGPPIETPVQTAPGPAPDEIEILSGLNPGDVIVGHAAGS